jgi:hypothetical protein
MHRAPPARPVASPSLTLLAALSLAALAAPAAPAALGAQRPLAPVTVIGRRAAEIDDLERRAMERFRVRSEWGDAGLLLARAAALRGPADERAVEDLRLAAFAFHAAGDRGRARRAMEHAAELAAGRGDVVGAANAYVDAGLVALEDHRDDVAGALAMKAELLANSPLIDAAQRAAIMARVGQSQFAGVNR